MTNEQKLEQLVIELNRSAGRTMYKQKDYSFLDKGWLKMQYSEDPKLNEKYGYDVQDATIPFFDNTLIDIIRVCERRYNESNFLLNGRFPKKGEVGKLAEETQKWARRFDFFRYVLNIHNHDAYLKYID